MLYQSGSPYVQDKLRQHRDQELARRQVHRDLVEAARNYAATEKHSARRRPNRLRLPLLQRLSFR